MGYALPTTHEAIALFVGSILQKNENARPFFPLSCHIARRPQLGRLRTCSLTARPLAPSPPPPILYTPFPTLQVICEKDERSDIPDIDKKKYVCKRRGRRRLYPNAPRGLLSRAWQ